MPALSNTYGNPLEKKLGLKNGMSVRFIHVPQDYFNLFHIPPVDLHYSEDPGIKKNFIHLFTKSKDELFVRLPQLKNEIYQDGCLWISWPKKYSKVNTEVNGNLVREYAIQCGLVDTKVCAVDNTWSALKLVIPLKERK